MQENTTIRLYRDELDCSAWCDYCSILGVNTSVDSVIIHVSKVEILYNETESEENGDEIQEN